MRVDHLNSLRALEAVLRTGGLRPAAEDLVVTPAAVGQHIRNLEEHLGLALLNRHPTGSVPTSIAEKVAGVLSRHMAGLRDVLDDLTPDNQPNRIALSVLPEFAANWFPRHLATLFSQVPGIDLRIDTSRSLVDLNDGEYDFAIRYAREPTAEHAYEPLLDDYCAPICTPEFAKRYKISSNHSSLEDVPMVEIDATALGASSDTPDLIDWCSRFSITPPSPQSGQVIVDYLTARKMAGSGHSILLGGIHDFVVELESGNVLLPFGSEKILLNEYKFWLIWRKDRRLSSAQKNFIRWICIHAAEDRERIERIISL